ncbi:MULTISPECIES: LuxR C-terminal-related transcriptional regulator [unclassified Streptomyces]|uniref:LuxR C-terminal-related transcriptional regulator n=1 Tax=unclassified Streptomyces TaxID=2593676 RepID=UPI003D8F5192
MKYKPPAARRPAGSGLRRLPLGQDWGAAGPRSASSTIARALHLGRETVKDHVHTLCVKLRAAHRIQAVRIAGQTDIATPPARGRH